MDFTKINDSDIEAVENFLSDLTPQQRALLNASMNLALIKILPKFINRITSQKEQENGNN